MLFHVNMTQFRQNWVWDTDTVHYGDKIAVDHGGKVGFDGSDKGSVLDAQGVGGQESWRWFLGFVGEDEVVGRAWPSSPVAAFFGPRRRIVLVAYNDSADELPLAVEPVFDSREAQPGHGAAVPGLVFLGDVDHGVESVSAAAHTSGRCRRGTECS